MPTPDTHLPRIWDGTQWNDLPYRDGVSNAGSTPGVSAGDLVAGESVAVAAANAYTDAQLTSRLGNYAPLNQLGSSSNPVTSASAARPTGLTVVYWLCSTQPTNLAAGDVWTDNS